MTSAMTLMKQEKEETKSAIALMQKENVDSRMPQNLVMGGLGLGGVLVVGSIGATIITGVAALATSGAFLVGGGYAYHKIKANAPAIRKKMRDDAMTKMIQDTKKNSIMHLQAAVLENTRKATASLEGVTKLRALVLNLETDLSKFEKGGKAYLKVEGDIKRFDDIHGKVLQVHTNMIARNKVFEKDVEEARQLHKVSGMIQEVTQFLDVNSGTTLDDILDTEAFDSIDMEFNEGIAQIESACAAAGVH